MKWIKAHAEDKFNNLADELTVSKKLNEIRNFSAEVKSHWYLFLFFVI